MMTEVVPSPTSSSCVRLISIIDFAAGCWTWICGRVSQWVWSGTREGGVAHLSEDGVTIVGHDYTSHWIHEHLEHSTRPEACSNDIGYRFGSLYISELCFPARLSLSVGIYIVGGTHLASVLACYKVLANLVRLNTHTQY